jgi:hypothetical protein
MSYKPLLICEDCSQYTKHESTGETFERRRAIFADGVIVRYAEGTVNLMEFKCSQCGSKRGWGTATER